MTRNLLLIIIIATITATVGCQGIKYFMYLMSPSGATETVEAEYTGLADSTTAIVIYADEKIHYEYPGAVLELSWAIAHQLREHVKGITVIDPARVVRYQHQNIYWDSMDRAKLAEVLGGDHLLFVGLMEFTTREPGSMNLYRGRVAAQASVYKAALPERRACLWRVDDIRVIYPKHAPTGQPGEDDSEIRFATEGIFADMLVKKFYKHKVPKGSRE